MIYLIAIGIIIVYTGYGVLLSNLYSMEYPKCKGWYRLAVGSIWPILILLEIMLAVWVIVSAIINMIKGSKNDK